LAGLCSPSPNQAGQRSDRQILEDILQKATVPAQTQSSLSEADQRQSLPTFRTCATSQQRNTNMSGVLRKQLRHLRDLGCIRQPIHTLPEQFELRQFLFLTDLGIDHLRKRDVAG
jgi:hypothetical protein